MKELPGYRIQEMEDGVFLIKDLFSDYLYVVAGEQRAAVIDTGMGVPGLMEAVLEVTDKPLVILNTHAHLDHIGGNDEFGSVYLHPLDWELYEKHGSAEYRTPKVTGMAEELKVELEEGLFKALTKDRRKQEFLPLSHGQVIDLGGVRLTVLHTPGHTKGSVCFYDGERKILFSGDTLCSMGVMLNFPESVSVGEFLETIHHLKGETQGVRAIYPGHHKVPLDASYFDKYLECGAEVLAHPELGEWEESACGRFRRFHYEDISLTYTNCEGRESDR